MTQTELRQKLSTEVDMLKGNIARICVTDDFNELERMVYFAMRRIHTIEDTKREMMLIEKYGPDYINNTMKLIDALPL